MRWWSEVMRSIVLPAARGELGSFLHIVLASCGLPAVSEGFQQWLVK
jgi:hypothetical protein